MINKRPLVFGIAGAVGLAGVAVAIALAPEPIPEGWPSAQAMVATLNPECLGCGTDAYNEVPAPHAMAFALLASAGAEMHDENVLRASADWLVENAHPTPTAVGWGLSFSNDAFGDGTENPAETVYAITTSLAVTGLLDAYEEVGTEAYLETAVAALDYYSSFFTETEHGGYFWYSDQPWDDISTYNVTSVLMGQYARAGVIADRPEFIAIADAAWGDLLAHREVDGSFETWPYSANGSLNDALHAAYIVQGIIEYTRARGSEIDLSRSEAYLLTFIAGERDVRQFSPVHELEPDMAGRPARLWGLGMLAYTLAELGNEPGAAEALAALRKYEFAPGQLANRPNDDPVAEPRMVAHAALAAAKVPPPQP